MIPGRIRPSLLGILTILLCAACAPFSPTTAQPLPAMDSDPQRSEPVDPGSEGPAADATPTPAPLTITTPAIIIESDTDALGASPEAPGIGLPSEGLVLFQPGPNSQATSTFQVAGWGGPSFKDRVQIRLLGEDGRVLSEGFSYLLVLPGNAGRFYETVPFEIGEVAQAARLEVSAFSPRDRQLSHLTTVNLILLSRGSHRLTSALHGPEKLAITYPQEEAIVSGGTVLVQGAGWVDSTTALTVSVTDHEGVVLGSAQVQLDTTIVGDVGRFAIEVAYDVDVPQWGRISVAEPSTDGIPGLIHLNSVEVWLRP